MYLLSPLGKANIEKEIPRMKEVEKVLTTWATDRLSSRDRNSLNKIQKGLQELILL